jgi:hypothetical protein
LPDLARAVRIKIEISALAKIFRRPRQAQDGSNLIPSKNASNRQRTIIAPGIQSTKIWAFAS